MFRKAGILIPLLITLLAACSQTLTPEAAAPPELALMFGTSGQDDAARLASHNLGVYVVGTTTGNLHSTHKGKGDVFIRKEDVYGGLLWGRQFGTSSLEGASGVASDASNNAYVVGVTRGSLGGKQRGNGDIYIRKYTANGDVAWTKQFGTSDYEFAHDIDVYGNSIYITWQVGAYTVADSILSKYTTDGTRVWTRHSNGVTNGTFKGAAIDHSGNVYVAGSSGIRGSEDTIIRKLTPNGGILWRRQLDYSNQDLGVTVAVSGNYVYLLTNYLSNNVAEDVNVAVTGFTPDGVQVWTNTYGGYGHDTVADASADSHGDLYFTGSTTDSFAGPHQGGFDAYVVKVSRNGYGPPLWSKTISTSLNDFGGGVLARPIASRTCSTAYFEYCTQVYTAGYTRGQLPYVDNQGGPTEAYLRRLYSGDGGTVWTK